MSNKIRIGVFLCHCGSNIAGIVDISALARYSEKLPNVVLVDEGKWSCSSDYLNKMEKLIKENEINRVVIASCSPRTHESLFKKAVGNSGLNPYLMEFVSIREQVSWVHMNYPKKATQKAKDLVKMGVAKAKILEEGFEIKLPVKRNCLIIGGGISGLNAALSIANQGFDAFVLEKKEHLGGLLRNIAFLVNENKKTPSNKILAILLEKVLKNKKIHIFTNSKIKSLKGYIGNYIVEIITDNDSIVTLPIDTIIVATGMQELKSEINYQYEKDPRILTQLELEREIINKELKVKTQKIVMITCVNSKNDKRGCCNIGCHITIKNAIALKKLNKKNSIHILYRDLSLHIKSGSMLSEAKKLGIIFIRFSDNFYPSILSQSQNLLVKTHDILLNKNLELKANKIILTTTFIGNKNTNEIKSLLKVSANKDDFFQEAHVKLNPLEFPSDGIGLCGCAKTPMFFDESFNEGMGAAMKVSIPMRKKYTKAEGIVANIHIKNCNKCLICSKKCPYNAIIVDSNDGYPRIIKALCRGCGLCAADCPSNSISIVHYTNEQLLAQITAALEESPKRKILGFVCHWCALGGVDMAGVGRLQYTTNIRLIRVMCSARVSIEMLKHSFKLGAAGVIVVGCEFPTCHYISGNYAAKKRIKKAKIKLNKLGFDAEKLWITWCSAADGPKFASTVNNMAKKLEL